MINTGNHLKNGSRTKGSVLVVDDNPDNLRLLVGLLTEKGYKVRPAPNGALALTSVQSTLPDLILLDIKMPEMDGYEVCRLLKADEKTRHVPILFISALSEVADKIKGFNIGAVDYITKPFQYEEVLARVHTHVSLSRMHRQLEHLVMERTAELTRTIERLDDEIKERKLAEEERSRFFEAIRQSDESIVITDSKGTIEFVNPAFEKKTGYSREEVLGENPRILQSGKHDPAFYREMWSSLIKGKTWEGELINKKKNGDLFVEKVTISPVFDDQGKIINYISVKHDVTKQRALEEQLRHAQKMETVGRLAGGVAHDFNNMLSVILGTTELILRRDDIDGKILQYLRQIQGAAKRSADITQQLLAFSRKQVIDPKVVNLNPLVKDITRMLARLLGEDIDILFFPEEDIGNIKVDTGQLHQIVSNLCINARDAMPDGGKLTIETANVTFSEEYCRFNAGFIPGNFVMLAISDNGTGIDKEIMIHIFEPFFTTKEEGKGTGLGLASVYGAVKHNKGFINVYSEPGLGTTFKLYFPRYAKKDEAIEDTGSEVKPMDPVDILLVEDNDMVRTLTKTMLETLGHTVCSAETPEKALAICADGENNFDLLLSDVIMPQMSGQELKKSIEALQPSINTLFMSGYTANVIAHHGVLNKDICFLQKPFSMGDLAKKVREAVF